MYSIGIDIGGTSIKAAAWDGSRIIGEVLRSPTIGIDGRPRAGEAVDELIANLMAAAGGTASPAGNCQGTPPVSDAAPVSGEAPASPAPDRPVPASAGNPSSAQTAGGCAGIGVGTPGLVDREGYFTGDAVNIPGWASRQIKDYLMGRWGLPVTVANDVNMAAYGEWRLGAARGSRSMVCVALGTGIGSGIIVDGELLVGAGGMAGEIGHVVVEPGGRKCNCGLSGCLERYSSATGISESARIMAPGIDSPLSREIAAGEDPAFPSARRLYQALADGDALAEAVHRDSSAHLARAVGILAQTVNPETIVFGGGVARAGEIIIEGIRTALPAYVMPMSLEKMDIRLARLGEFAGVYGAALRAWDLAEVEY